MGLLSGVSEEDAVVWRGPKKQSMIGQLLKEVAWDDLDVVVIDTPPGTSDEHLSMVKTLKETGVLAKTTSILVTTPQMASLQDVAREINFCTKESLKIDLLGNLTRERIKSFSPSLHTGLLKNHLILRLKKTQIKMLGLVENMSGFVCPNCSECSNLFNSGGGQKLAEKYNLDFLGKIPIDPNFGLSLDKGCNFVEKFESTQTAKEKF